MKINIFTSIGFVVILNIFSLTAWASQWYGGATVSQIRHREDDNCLFFNLTGISSTFSVNKGHRDFETAERLLRIADDKGKSVQVLSTGQTSCGGIQVKTVYIQREG